MGKYIDELKNKFLETGYSDLKTEEILSLNLYYGGCKDEPDKVAKNLLGKYSSFSEVLKAPREVLQKIGTMKESTAIFLNLLPEISRLCIKNKIEQENARGIDNLKEQLSYNFIGQTVEVFAVLLLSERNKVLFNGIISKGTVSKVNTYIKEIINIAKKYKAKKMIVAHNHPYGCLKPSENDILFTENLTDMLDAVGIEVIDHLIFINEDYISIKNNKK